MYAHWWDGPWGTWATLFAITAFCILMAYLSFLAHESWTDRRDRQDRREKRDQKRFMTEQLTLQMDSAKGDPKMLEWIRRQQDDIDRM